METITFKRGNTFEILGSYANDEDVPITLDGINVKSQIRKGNTLVGDFEVQILNQDEPTSKGKFRLLFADTSGWPLGPLSWDILYSFDDTEISTETIMILVVDGVTQND